VRALAPAPTLAVNVLALALLWLEDIEVLRRRGPAGAAVALGRRGPKGRIRDTRGPDPRTLADRGGSASGDAGWLLVSGVASPAFRSDVAARGDVELLRSKPPGRGPLDVAYL
jgi:hypothetical protein